MHVLLADAERQSSEPIISFSGIRHVLVERSSIVGPASDGQPFAALASADSVRHAVTSVGLRDRERWSPTGLERPQVGCRAMKLQPHVDAGGDSRAGRTEAQEPWRGWIQTEEFRVVDAELP